MDSRLELLLYLLSIPGIGPKKVSAILPHITSISDLHNLTPKEIELLTGLHSKHCKEIIKPKIDLSYLHSVMEDSEKLGWQIIPYYHNKFPKLFKQFDGMPAMIFFKGNLSVFDQPGLGVVGTRKPSPYGIRSTEQLTAELVQSGFSIISGFARGIDTIAHKTALQQSGSTVAILGSGFHHIYPKENSKLIPEIIERGGILTEFLPNTIPDATNFPQRNRLISALSLGTLVVEAAETGGALITAAFALEMNREVFAVPGDIFSSSSVGTNRLIQNGQAKLVLKATDVLEEFPDIQLIHSTLKKAEPQPELSFFEQEIFDLLSNQPVHVDVLAQQTKKPISAILIELLNLEFNGLIRQLPGKYFVRKGK